MRLAFNIPSTFNSEKDNIVKIGVMDLGTIENGVDRPDLTVTWARSKVGDKWCLINATIEYLSPRCYKLFKTVVKRMVTLNDSPMVFCRNLVASRSSQVVWDNNLKKWRNVSTMKDSDDLYELVGLKDSTVTASDDEHAIRRAKKLVTELMMENPEQASTLSAFFSQGCKVKKLTSGKAPTAIEIAKLVGPGEENLAKTPIKMAPKTDKELDKADKSEKDEKKSAKK